MESKNKALISGNGWESCIGLNEHHGCNSSLNAQFFSPIRILSSYRLQIVPTRRDQTHLFLGFFFQCSCSLSDYEGHFGRVISFCSALLSSLARHNLSLFFFLLAFIIQTENGYGFSSSEKRVICFFCPIIRRLWNFSSTHMGVMWSFQLSKERAVMSGKPASSGWLPSPFMVRVVWPHIISNCSFLFLFFLGTVPAIFLKKNSVKLLTKATWAYFVNLSLASIIFYWCCKSRGYVLTWVLELKVSRHADDYRA